MVVPPLKWVALAMMIGGIASLWAALPMDGKASFEDSSFILEIVLGGGGTISLVLGCILMLVAVFIAA
jgi:hypothetical protein